MKVEIGDLVFCHTIGNKMGWRLNQVGIVVAGSKKDTRFRAFLSSGGFDEFTTTDIEKGNIEIIAKASGEKVTYSKDIEVIPNYSRALRDSASKIDIDENILNRTFNQRFIKTKNLRRKTKIKL
tara:strand:- start:85 stop:456 length:372 start_codon:yes stop_codon:yes gene_type:complete